MLKHAFLSKSADGMVNLFCKLGAGPLFASLLISILQMKRGNAFFEAPAVWISLALSLCLLNMALEIYIAPWGIGVYAYLKRLLKAVRNFLWCLAGRL
jgi:hypothetical protein